MIDPDIEIKNKKNQATKDTAKYLQMDNNALLEEIFYVASKPPELSPSKTTDDIIVRFSALLVNLSQQADKSTQRIIKLTNRLLYLTIAIVGLTIALLFLEFRQEPNKINEYPKLETQQTQQKNNTKPVSEK